MKKNNHHSVKGILVFVGLFELIAGLSHAFMPHFIYRSSGFAYLQPDEINIVTCSIFSVGILLVAFGALTIIFAIKYYILNKLLVLYFVSTKSVLWALRILLELMYPTEVALYLIERPSVLFIPAFVFVDCLLILSIVMIRRDINEKSLELAQDHCI